MQITFRSTTIYDDTTTGVNWGFVPGSRAALIEEVQAPRADGVLLKALGRGSATHTLTLTYLGTASELQSLQTTLTNLSSATTGTLSIPTINGTLTYNYCSLQTPTFGQITPMARLGQTYKNRLDVTLQFKQTRG